MDRTRDKLLATAAELVAAGGAEELTVRAVAAAAQISVPTAYRYFGSREALLDALADWINDKLFRRDYPRDVADTPEFARRLFSGFAEQDRLVRAQLQSPAGREVRRREQQRRYKTIGGIIARSLPRATPAARRYAAALIQSLLSANTWIAMHDHWGLDGTEAGELVRWALGLVAAELGRDPRALDAIVERAQARKSKEEEP
jgi:AcrR family transcriptional regulator